MGRARAGPGVRAGCTATREAFPDPCLSKTSITPFVTGMNPAPALARRRRSFSRAGQQAKARGHVHPGAWPPDGRGGASRVGLPKHTTGGHFWAHAHDLGQAGLEGPGELADGALPEGLYAHTWTRHMCVHARACCLRACVRRVHPCVRLCVLASLRPCDLASAHASMRPRMHSCVQRSCRCACVRAGGRAGNSAGRRIGGDVCT